jgi:hypothetical protein
MGGTTHVPRGVLRVREIGVFEWERPTSSHRPSHSIGSPPLSLRSTQAPRISAATPRSYIPGRHSPVSADLEHLQVVKSSKKRGAGVFVGLLCDMDWCGKPISVTQIL